MIELPPAFLQRMQALLGTEYAEFLASYGEPPSAGLRTNTLKLAAADFAALSPFPLQEVSWCPEGFFLPAAPGPRKGESQESAPGRHPYHSAGLYYLQDPAAMAAVALLDPQPGERILDLSAAPGGKSTHIAARLQGRGLLVANEIHPRRAWNLAENLERFGVHNAMLTQETPERLAEHFGAYFDRVLLDAPCSGEGMFRKSATARQEWSLELVRGCAVRQASIIDQAARLVKPGGLLAYVTCTFAPEEDEALLAAFLERQWKQFGVHFELLEAPPDPAFAPGRPDWLAGILAGSVALERFSLHKAVRLWPQRGAGDGHFIALLRRDAALVESGASGVDSPALPGVRQAQLTQRQAQLTQRQAQLTQRQARSLPYSPSKDALLAYQRFCKETLACAAEERLLLEGQYLYSMPKELSTGEGAGYDRLRLIHPGWWLGEIHKERFIPAHALALGLRAQDALQVVRLSPKSSEIAAYLGGEVLSSPGSDGWVLVCVDTAIGAFPLGWGRRAQGRLKNHYPKGLRQQK